MTEHRPIVRVIWRDAHAVTTTWTHPDEMDDEPCLVESIGIMLNNVKPGHLVLAQSHIVETGDLDHVLAVPIPMVVRIETLHTASLLPVEPPA